MTPAGLLVEERAGMGAANGRSGADVLDIVEAMLTHHDWPVR